MELGDMEAAFVGNLARYCMHMGTLPPFSLRGLWWVNGVCRGLGVVDWESDVEPIIPLIHHMQHYAPFIVGTEGVEDLLQAGKDTRWWSEKLFPNEAYDWVSEEHAIELAGRTVQTLREWRRAGTVRFIKDGNGILYKKDDLMLMLDIRAGNKMRNHLRRGTN